MTIDEVLALDSAKSYMRKQVEIGRTTTAYFNKSAALATFQKKSEKMSHFPASYWKSSSKVAKKDTKHSSNTLLRVVTFSAEQTLN